MNAQNDDLPPLDGQYSVDEEATKAEKTLDSIVEQLGGTAGDDLMLKVYKLDPETGKRSWVYDARPSELPLERMLQKRFKGGDFEIRVYAPNPDSSRGGKSMHAVVPVCVEPIAEPEPGPAAPAAPQYDIAEVLERMQANTADMIKQMSEQNRLTLENALLKSQQGGGFDLKQIFEVLPMLRDLLGGNNQKSMAEQMNELIDLQNKLKGDGGDSDEWPVLRAFDRIADIVKSGHGPQADRQPVGYRDNPAPRAVGQPGAGAGAPAADQSNNEEEQAMFIKKAVKSKLLELCQRAEADRDPVIYAEVLLDDIPDAFYGQLRDNLKNSDDEAVENFAQICPEVADYREWFTRLAACLRAALVEPDDADDLTPAPGGGNNTVTHSDGQSANESAAAGAGDTDNT